MTTPRPSQSHSSQSQADSNTPVRVDKLLFPDPLIQSATPEEFRLWKGTFERFIASGNVDKAPPATQQAYLFRCLSPELQKTLAPKITGATPVSGANGCLQILESEFHLLHPTFTRRMEFFQATRAPQEDLASCLERLDSLQLEADIESLDHGGITVFKFLAICGDDDLRKKIFDSKVDTLPHIKELVRQHTAQLRSIESIRALPPDHPARGLREVWHELSVSEEGLLIVGGTRMFIPVPLRAGILKLLHKGHTGLQKTWATAKSLYFWPHMRSHLQQEIDKCEPCQALKPSLPKEPLIHTTARFPMERASADLFQFGSQHYIVLVDRYSGLPMINKLGNLSSATVIRVLTELFDTFGWPLSLRTDGGPQFRSEFKAFCVAHDISHELSSPYHPESNGHAESAVKNVKHLMEKSQTIGIPSSLCCLEEHETGRPAQSKWVVFRPSIETSAATHALHSLSGWRNATCSPCGPGQVRDPPSVVSWNNRLGAKPTHQADGQQRLRFSPPAAQVAPIPSRRKKPRPSRATDGSLGHDTWSTKSEIIYLYIKLGGGMFSSLCLSIYLSISLYLWSLYLSIAVCYSVQNTDSYRTQTP